jgi:CRP-like cAMP-binding protein
MTMHQQLLRHIQQFVKLDGEEERLVVASFKVKRLKKKQFLQIIGEQSKYETFVNKGCLKTYYINDKGEEHIVQFSMENWWVGDLYSFLTDTDSIYNIEALEDCELLQIDKNTLNSLYINVPKLERYFRLLVQNAYIASTRRVLFSLSKTADERYADFLTRYPGIDQRIPQYLIASYLGITPEFLSKIRRRLAGK